MDKNKFNFNYDKKKKKISLNQKKNNMIKSLTEIEQFLRNSNKISQYFKFYKIIKK